MNTELLVEFCNLKNIVLLPEQIEAFIRFEKDLYEANEHTNLTRVEQEDATSRHFIDSLMIVDLLPKGAKVLDIGSGPGFPSWPLACVRPDLQVSAMDSNLKLLNFLSDHLLPNLRVIPGRAEECSLRGHFDVITGRALAPLSIQLELSVTLCKLNGLLIPFRTPKDLEEIERFPADTLGLELEQVVHLPIIHTEIVRVFPIYRKIRPTPLRYPRSWTNMRKAPL